MVPTSYGIRWTCKLICRDLKGMTARYTTRVRDAFSRATTDVTVSVANTAQLKMEPLDDREEFSDIADTGLDHSSLITDGNNSIPSADVSDDASSTPYDLLITNLKDLYASRERDLPLKERWMFRGAWLLLHMATQYCASNPIYDIWKCDSSSASEYTVVQESLPSDASMAVGPRPHVSQMSPVPNVERDGDSTRHDSVFSTPSSQNTSFSAPPNLLWNVIHAGALDHTKTVFAAEYLLGLIWTEVDATAMLEVIGDPAKRLSEVDETELRKRLCRMLYPERSVDGPLRHA